MSGEERSTDQQRDGPRYGTIDGEYLTATSITT